MSLSFNLWVYSKT